MARNLTDHIVRTARPKRDQKGWREESDAACRGLRLRISPEGEKRWGIQVSVSGGGRQRHTFASYPSMSLADARKKAQWYKEMAREGISPEEADKGQANAVTPAVDIYERYLHWCINEGKFKRNTIINKKGYLKNYYGSAFGDLSVGEIDRTAIKDLVNDIREMGYSTQSNRVLSDLKAFLNWCVQEDQQYIDAVPPFPKKTSEQSRDRILKTDEIRAVFQATHQMSERARDLTWLILFTLQRRDEVRLMRWKEVDLEAATWEIPAQRYKTNVAMVVPLTSLPLEILKRRHQHATGPYVFASDPNKPFNGHARAIKTLRKLVAGMLELPEHPDFTYHDMRRTGRTLLAMLGENEDVSERVIGHLPPGIRRTYNQYDYIREKKRALERLSAHLMELAAGSRIDGESAA